ncbi:phosphoribosylformylglycinamidine synthase I [Methanosalsum zhilinae DSM 4017]|uniref:Phosphoribosylformylglycinamidine synthase subunit PurQ n=1 Tax=Methanosalsum zhilinae (strain DSM 4017 / NBRC 107636 / OCM 62 / WeN5) TaxID=679901 RepID=F7XPP5_METZD|nr:phosphoribosylformylglycinamidine synthase I [Methanosalsum zhilinae]AEH60315.1 phosphoribosylformylglycinamidine synthase I [Methanosalsum zhilinae DSM 4017]
MKIAIVQFGGSNCDMDVLHVLNEVVNVNAELVWYKNDDLTAYDAAVIPGGFSYGDYLRAGAIAARTPIMKSIKKMADTGKPIIGICNGFQILTESGILKGALATNMYPKFICEWVSLRVENTDTPFTCMFKKGEVIRIPIAHKEGNYYASSETLSELNLNDQVVFRYSDEDGSVSDKSNPNGSKENIAGIINDTKNVLGLMPHPERASQHLLGSEDGLKIFQSMVEYISES